MSDQGNVIEGELLMRSSFKLWKKKNMSINIEDNKKIIGIKNSKALALNSEWKFYDITNATVKFDDKSIKKFKIIMDKKQFHFKIYNKEETAAWSFVLSKMFNVKCSSHFSLPQNDGSLSLTNSTADQQKRCDTVKSANENYQIPIARRPVHSRHVSETGYPKEKQEKKLISTLPIISNKNETLNLDSTDITSADSVVRCSTSVLKLGSLDSQTCDYYLLRINFGPKFVVRTAPFDLMDAVSFTLYNFINFVKPRYSDKSNRKNIESYICKIIEDRKKSNSIMKKIPMEAKQVALEYQVKATDFPDNLGIKIIKDKIIQRENQRNKFYELCMFDKFLYLFTSKSKSKICNSNSQLFFPTLSEVFAFPEVFQEASICDNEEMFVDAMMNYNLLWIGNLLQNVKTLIKCTNLPLEHENYTCVYNSLVSEVEKSKQFIKIQAITLFPPVFFIRIVDGNNFVEVNLLIKFCVNTTLEKMTIITNDSSFIINYQLGKRFLLNIPNIIFKKVENRVESFVNDSLSLQCVENKLSYVINFDCIINEQTKSTFINNDEIHKKAKCFKVASSLDNALSLDISNDDSDSESYTLFDMSREIKTDFKASSFEEQDKQEEKITLKESIPQVEGAENNVVNFFKTIHSFILTIFFYLSGLALLLAFFQNNKKKKTKSFKTENADTSTKQNYLISFFGIGKNHKGKDIITTFGTLDNGWKIQKNSKDCSSKSINDMIKSDVKLMRSIISYDNWSVNLYSTQNVWKSENN